MPSVSRKPRGSRAFSTAPAVGAYDGRSQTWLEELARLRIAQRGVSSGTCIRNLIAGQPDEKGFLCLKNAKYAPILMCLPQ